MVAKSGLRRCGWWAAGAVFILGIVLGAPTGAGAQQPPVPMQEQHRWTGIQQRLGLTPDQMTALQKIFAANRTTMRDDFQAMQTAHQALRAAWSKADANAISAAASQVQAAQNKLFNDRLQGQLSILNALGPDLFKQWTALHTHYRGEGPGFWHKHHRHGGHGFWHKHHRHGERGFWHKHQGHGEREFGMGM